jgi:hypothetical protein
MHNTTAKRTSLSVHSQHATTRASTARTSHTFRVAITLAAMLSATLIAACGGSGDPAAPTQAAAPQAQAQTPGEHPSSTSRTAQAPEPLVVRACCGSDETVDAKALQAAAGK